MRALLVTVTLLLMSGLLWFMVQHGLSGPSRCPCAHGQSEAMKAPPTVTNRVWRDRNPKDGKDLTFHLVLLDKAKVRTGITASLSQWRYHVDRLRYRLKGSTLLIESPQDGQKATFEVKTWACKGEAPAPFDLCLQLKKSGRKLVLYSQAHGGFAQEDLRVIGLTQPSAQQLGDDEAEPNAQGGESLPEWFERLAN